MDRMSDWHTQLIAAGANFGGDGLISDFGEPLDETAALKDGAAVVPLMKTGLISVSGEDALSFLNAQLTNDVGAASASRAQYSGYCTPKGRLLATMLLFAQDKDYLLVLPEEIAQPVAARLGKYVLRARARLDLRGPGIAMFGVCGARAPVAVADGLSLPGMDADFRICRTDDGVTAVSLPGNRTLVMCQAADAASTWQNLLANARPAGSHVWALQTIRAGIATIAAATQEMFTPQMVALDTFGGVSFEKGCYPGQEIVARTRYLGEVKRHLYRGRCAQAVVPGTTVVATRDGKSVGTVADAAQAQAGQWEFLAVLQREAVTSNLALQLQDGGALAIDSAVE
jgi:tRNA-modifying protein YgfZ